MTGTLLKQQRYFIYFLLCIVFYVCAVVVYSIWSNLEAKNNSYREIDGKLLQAAESLKYILAPDFHDRAVDQDSISPEEITKNRIAISSYALETEFEWLYTLVEKEGKFYFSAPTVTEEELKERESWYFYPYGDIPPEFVQAYELKQPVYVNYTDQWGVYRSIALPQVSPNGRTYLACADYKTGDINRILRKNFLHSILSALFFLLVSIPFIVAFYNFSQSYNEDLKQMNRELMQHKYHLEKLVTEQTNALRKSNESLKEEIAQRTAAQKELQEKHDKLQQALNEVKTLSGLLPICSYCKKIRDDRGYWNQLEGFIRDRSDAEFSHSLCPECMKQHYPNIKKRPDPL